jgi:hypothetical protein
MSSALSGDITAVVQSSGEAGDILKWNYYTSRNIYDDTPAAQYFLQFRLARAPFASAPFSPNTKIPDKLFTFFML